MRPRQLRLATVTSTAAAGLLVVSVLGACTSDGTPASGGRTLTQTSTQTLTRSPESGAVPAATYAPRYRGHPPQGEKRKKCPYIRAGENIETGRANTTFADLEGNRIGVSTVLTGLKPVGCRFYFANDAPDNRHAVGDILPQTLPTSQQAYNTMVRIGRSGFNVQGYPNFASGANGISYQTKFYKQDGSKDWAFVFAVGTKVVVVRTDQTDASLNARNIAKAIVGHFR